MLIFDYVLKHREEEEQECSPDYIYPSPNWKVEKVKDEFSDYLQDYQKR